MLGWMSHVKTTSLNQTENCLPYMTHLQFGYTEMGKDFNLYITLKQGKTLSTHLSD